MGSLTTHVLDTARGIPAADLQVELLAFGPGEPELFKTQWTNADGRPPEPMLTEAEFAPGQWQLVFHVADYFRRAEIEMSEPAFLQVVPIRFGIAAADQHYHVPLLVSPWSYSTYRGS